MKEVDKFNGITLSFRAEEDGPPESWDLRVKVSGQFLFEDSLPLRSIPPVHDTQRSIPHAPIRLAVILRMCFESIVPIFLNDASPKQGMAFLEPAESLSKDTRSQRPFDMQNLEEHTRAPVLIVVYLLNRRPVAECSDVGHFARFPCCPVCC